LGVRSDAFCKAERILFCSLAAIFGVFLPLFTGWLYPPDGAINPFWGSLFGIGSWIEYALFGAPPFGLLGLLWGLIGLVLWPVALLLFFNRLLRVVQHSHSRLALTALYVAFIATLAFDLPVTAVSGSAIEKLPIYVKYLDFAPR
jgi:hypothetical protein